MPCKNAEPFLHECIGSIIDQSYSNWELVVCDDGSTDDSRNLLKGFCEKDSRINYIKNRGTGIISALKLAYELSTGSFITRMDADDKMPPNKLETLHSLLTESKHKDAVSTGKVKYFPEELIQDGYRTYEGWINNLCDNDTHWKEIYKECVIPSPCWMMHRSTFNKIGAFSSNVYPEDYELVWRMFMNDLKVLCSKQVLHYWRDHSKRTSRNSETYQTQTYFKLKVEYMLQIPKLKEKKWIVWGAGKKGKTLVQHLIQNGKKNISWVCNNPKKIGLKIYGIKLQDYLQLRLRDREVAILVTVSNTQERERIKAFMQEYGYQFSKDYFILA